MLSLSELNAPKKIESRKKENFHFIGFVRIFMVAAKKKM